MAVGGFCPPSGLIGLIQSGKSLRIEANNYLDQTDLKGPRKENTNKSLWTGEISVLNNN